LGGKNCDLVSTGFIVVHDSSAVLNMAQNSTAELLLVCAVQIACVSGCADNLEETVNTLKYANRARNIRNRAVINKEVLRGADGLSDEQRAMALLNQVHLNI
jgi:kinesin family protein 4/21/27